MPSIWLVVGFFVLFCLCMWRKRTQPAFFLDIGIQSSITTCWGLVYSAPNYKKLKPNIWSFPNTFISFLAFSYILLFPVASLFIFLYFPLPNRNPLTSSVLIYLYNCLQQVLLWHCGQIEDKEKRGPCQVIHISSP